MENGPVRRFSTRIAVSAALTVSGCVSVADGPSPTDPHRTTTTQAPPTTTTNDLETSLEGYRDCLGENGVTVGAIATDGRGRPTLLPVFADVDRSRDVVVEAMAECAPLLADGALASGSDPLLAALVSAELDNYVHCMRRNGVPDFPDPIAGFRGVGPAFDTTLVPWDDSDLVSAVSVCSADLTRSSS